MKALCKQMWGVKGVKKQWIIAFQKKEKWTVEAILFKISQNLKSIEIVTSDIQYAYEQMVLSGAEMVSSRGSVPTSNQVLFFWWADVSHVPLLPSSSSKNENKGHVI